MVAKSDCSSGPRLCRNAQYSCVFKKALHSLKQSKNDISTELPLQKAIAMEAYMINQDMAIAIISFDGYSDIWDVFALCINKFWKDRAYKTYLVTNDAHPLYEGIKIVNTGREVSWSHRVRTALDSIPEEYVLLLLEDYLISEKVDNAKVGEALTYMINEGLDYLRIAPIPKIKKAKHVQFAPITSKTLYGVNLQAAIWKKEYLLKTLSDENLSAWEFEARQKFGEETRVEGKCYAASNFVIKYLNGIYYL